MQMQEPAPASQAAKADPMADSSIDGPVMEIQANVLPDVYPEEHKKH